MDKKLSNPPDFYITAEQECNYLQQQSKNIFLDPETSPTIPFYQELIQHGFRRSGGSVYRPHCDNCSECCSVRVKVNEFRPKTSQKRCIKKNLDISLKSLPAEYKPEHFQLYKRYLNSRHKGAGMDDTSKEDYVNFLSSDWSNTRFIEFRLQQEDNKQEKNKLVAVAVTDVLPNALSSVYTFFEPDSIYQKRSLGVYAILSQIEEAKRLGLDWVYLGYWIKDNQKMAYKNQYKPAEFLKDGIWQPIV